MAFIFGFPPNLPFSNKAVGNPPQTAGQNNPDDMPHENTRVIISAIAGGAVGYFLHVLKSRGDRKARKEAIEIEAESARKNRIREFKSFMSGLRFWAQTASEPDQVRGWHAKANSFCEETAKIRDDVPRDKIAAFNTAVTTFSSLTVNEVSQYKKQTEIYKGSGRLVKMIDAVVQLSE